jgi:UDP-2,4-diacetamido-2,4,6-trideoxy-beta-L-altropyranose hydrolase
LSTIVFRCDGGERIGAGHVSRCLRIAEAFEAAGVETLFVGRYEGLALALLEAAGARTAPPGPGPAGIPAEAQGAVLDSYELEAADVEAAARELPLAVISDGAPAPPGAIVLSYHLDAEGADIAGPDHAPIDPRCAAARRERGLRRVLITLGLAAGEASLQDRVLAAAQELGDVELSPALPGRGADPAGLAERIAWADLAVSAAGVTAYELACAGVPALVLAVADNQARVASAFDARGLAIGLDARDRLPEGEPAASVGRLADAGLRARLAAAGPAVVDGYGACRARDALRAAFASEPPPRVLRYRPATPADSDLLLAWRNDPPARAASRNRAPVTEDEHRRWLAATLADPTRVLLVVEAEGEPVGRVLFELADGEAEIGLIVAPGSRGRGLGTQAVRESCELLLASRRELRRVMAEVREDNPASLSAFERAGFGPTGEEAEPGFKRLAADRAALAAASISAR